MIACLICNFASYDRLSFFGRFATALIDHGLDSWVMNVVPISGRNTLPVLYDRGLIGVNHDWYGPYTCLSLCQSNISIFTCWHMPIYKKLNALSLIV